MRVLASFASLVLACSAAERDPGADIDGSVHPCHNRYLDPGEIDIDCGDTCGPCDDGARCGTHAQCASGACVEFHCVVGARFAAPRSFLAGLEPTAAEVADVNRDGRPDLLVALRNEPSLAMPQAHLATLIALADGTFAAPVLTIMPGFPFAIAVADFNEDGVKDAALPDAFTDQIEILLGDGKQGFRRPVNQLGTRLTLTLATGDFDGDGHADLVAVGDSILVLGGDGKSGFVAGQPTQRFDRGFFSRTGIAVADFNEDGRSDVALSDRGLRILSGRPGQRLMQIGDLTPGRYPGRMVTADFNGDEHADLAYTLGGTLTVRLGIGDGTFGSGIDAPGGVGSNASLASADFDGDGMFDLASADGDGLIKYWRSSGAGSLEEPLEAPAGIGASALVAADFNGDHLVDLAAPCLTTGDVTLHLGREGGALAQALPLDLPSSPGAIDTGDLDGDGRDDIVFADGDRISVLRSDGAGFEPQVDYPVGSAIDVLRLADVDGNGRPDVLGASRDTGIVYLLRNAAGAALAKPRNIDATNDPSWLTTGDLDGDGMTDVVVVDHDRGEVRVLFARAPADFKPAQRFESVAGAFAAAVCDLDANGHADLVVVNVSALIKNITVMLGRGGGVLDAPVGYGFGGRDPKPYAAAIACGDFDGRGGDDVAAVNVGSGVDGMVGLLLSNPDGTLPRPEKTNYFSDYLSTGLGSLRVGALHRGTRLHLVTASLRGATVLVGDGGGTFRDERTYRITGGSVRDALLADFDGDGRSDLVALASGAPSGIVILTNGTP